MTSGGDSSSRRVWYSRAGLVARARASGARARARASS